VQAPYTIATIPGTYQPMYVAPYINKTYLQDSNKNAKRKDKEDDEISHFSGEKIDLNKVSIKKNFKEEKEKNVIEKSGKTNKVIKELNDNLEEFQFEFTRQISKMNVKFREFEEGSGKD
jgi:predicted AlkP superfamily phosphohydrolase/phosphomutase